MIKKCSIEDCSNPSHAKGFCIAHYHRFIRYGDPLKVKIYLGDESKRFWTKVDKKGPNECWNWIRGKHHGYGNFHVHRNGIDKVLVSTRYVWEITNGKIPDGLLICHKCDNRACVNPNHLFLGTYQENVDDRDRKHRFVKLEGELNGCSKLSDNDIINIRKQYRKEFGVASKLAKKYGISITHILRIVQNKVWKHLL